MPAPIAINGRFLLAPPHGVQRVGREMLRALDALNAEQGGNDLELLCPSGGATGLGMRAIHVREIGRFTGNAWEQLDLPPATRGRVLLNLCNASPLTVRGGMTFIHDAQVYLSPESYSPTFRSWYRFALPRIARNAAKIVTVSEYSRQMLVKHGVAPANRIAVIPNGVDHIARVTPDPAIIERLSLTGKRFAIALASTQHHKNIGLLLKAFAGRDLADTTLVLVGRARRSDFERAGMVCSPNVIFAGVVSDGELRSLYEHALCFACPSLTEGFGLPPLEAMLLGCPAVVAPCGALPETCGDAAVYADSASAAEWRHAVLAFADSPALRRVRSETGKRQAARFTWRRSAMELAAELGSLDRSAA